MISISPSSEHLYEASLRQSQLKHAPENGPGLLPGHECVLSLSCAHWATGAGLCLFAPDDGHASPAPQLVARATRDRGQRHRVLADRGYVPRRALTLPGGDVPVDLRLHAALQPVSPARVLGRHGIGPRTIHVFPGDGWRRTEVLFRLCRKLRDRRLRGCGSPDPRLAVKRAKCFPAALGWSICAVGKLLPIRGPAASIGRVAASGNSARRPVGPLSANAPTASSRIAAGARQPIRLRR